MKLQNIVATEKGGEPLEYSLWILNLLFNMMLLKSVQRNEKIWIIFKHIRMWIVRTLNLTVLYYCHSTKIYNIKNLYYIYTVLSRGYAL